MLWTFGHSTTGEKEAFAPAYTLHGAIFSISYHFWDIVVSNVWKIFYLWGNISVCCHILFSFQAYGGVTMFWDIELVVESRNFFITLVFGALVWVSPLEFLQALWHQTTKSPYTCSVVSMSLYVNIASISDHGIELLSPICQSVCQSVCPESVLRKMYCGKTADWNQMPFGMVSGVDRGMGVLDGNVDRWRGRGSFGAEFGVSHWNQWGLCCIVVWKCMNWPRCHLGYWDSLVEEWVY